MKIFITLLAALAITANGVLAGLPMTNDESSAYFYSQQMRYMLIPRDYDARAEGRITSVKEQGKCNKGSAVFASVSALETCLHDAARRHNEPVDISDFDISEQQYLDCGAGATFMDPVYGELDLENKGCNGGWPESYLMWGSSSRKNPLHENAYPFVVYQNHLQCQSDEEWTHGATHETTYYTYHCGADLLKKLIFIHGAVVVRVCSTDEGFINYKGGIIMESQRGCALDYEAQMATAVGYGVEGGVEYFIVKNSWGTEWGEEGYFRVKSGVLGVTANCVVPICSSSAIMDAVPTPPEEPEAPAAPTAPSCNVSGTWGFVNWDPEVTYHLPVRTADGSYVFRPVKCTTDNICTPQEEGVEDACQWICNSSGHC